MYLFLFSILVLKGIWLDCNYFKYSINFFMGDGEVEYVSGWFFLEGYLNVLNLDKFCF